MSGYKLWHPSQVLTYKTVLNMIWNDTLRPIENHNPKTKNMEMEENIPQFQMITNFALKMYMLNNSFWITRTWFE